MRTEIELVCAGCGESCLICDLETEVTLTHCTECANKRISELEAKLGRVRELPRYASIKCGSSHPKAPDGTFVRFDELAEALADD